MPQELAEGGSELWNLYVDDLSILEVMQEGVLDEIKARGEDMSPLQSQMRAIYEHCQVPYSKTNSESRVLAEKLGALLSRRCGRLGVSQARSLASSLCVSSFWGQMVSPRNGFRSSWGSMCISCSFGDLCSGLHELASSVLGLRTRDVSEVWMLLAWCRSETPA